MVSRRAPRPVWLPALFLWAPLSFTGLWLTAGIRFHASSVGDQEWSVRIIFPAPSQWLVTPLSYVGLALLAVGILAWFLAMMQPDPRRWFFVGARYPEFAMAGHLLLAASVLSFVHFAGPVFDAGSGGLSWRAIADVRSVGNQVLAAMLATVAALAYAMSLGPSRRLWV